MATLLCVGASCSSLYHLAPSILQSPMHLNSKQIAYQGLAVLIIAFGFFLRLDQYLFDRSLWLDEACIAIDVINKTFWELLRPPLDYSDAYKVPPGFFIVTKLSLLLFGKSDLILRGFPFLCGVVALPLYYQMAKAYVSKPAVLLALFLFAISDPLIYFSSEFKQYSSDVTITIILFLLLVSIQNQGLTKTQALVLATLGSIAIWFSHPSLVILATLGSYLFFQYAFHQQWKALTLLVMVGTVWLLNFALLYFFFIQIDYAQSPISRYVVHFLEEVSAFMPTPFSTEGIRWLHETYSKTLVYPGNITGYTALVEFIVLVGSVFLFIHNKRTLWLLTLPFFITLLLSYFYQYPFYGRLILFLLPALYLLIAEGVVNLRVHLTTVNTRFSTWMTAGLVGLCGILIVTGPTYRAIEHLRHPRTMQEIKPVLMYVQKNRQVDDTIYLYYWTEPAFRYYATSYNFKYEACHLISPIPPNEYTKEIDYFRQKHHFSPVKMENTRCVLGVSELFHQSLEDIKQLQGRGRVWFIFSHVVAEELKQFIQHLNKIGLKLDEFSMPYVHSYLYNL